MQLLISRYLKSVHKILNNVTRHHQESIYLSKKIKIHIRSYIRNQLLCKVDRKLKAIFNSLSSTKPIHTLYNYLQVNRAIQRFHINKRRIASALNLGQPFTSSQLCSLSRISLQTTDFLSLNVT